MNAVNRPGARAGLQYEGWRLRQCESRGDASHRGIGFDALLPERSMNRGANDRARRYTSKGYDSDGVLRTLAKARPESPVAFRATPQVSGDL
ncbi:MAG: hypothetical protein JO076_04805 [Verrucomicrobia bacterium]|nr:hypothetical protein [Verrucomicrobiota bacterium]